MSRASASTTPKALWCVWSAGLGSHITSQPTKEQSSQQKQFTKGSITMVSSSHITYCTSKKRVLEEPTEDRAKARGWRRYFSGEGCYPVGHNVHLEWKSFICCFFPNRKNIWVQEAQMFPLTITSNGHLGNMCFLSSQLWTEQSERSWSPVGNTH